MNRRFSLYLDGMRALAALVVLLSHWAYDRYTGGTFSVIRDLNLGSDAVVIFFVLSGFVIGFTAQNKDDTLGSFVFARTTRLYSVAVPAIILTIILDRIGLLFRPDAYDGFWYNDAGILETAAFGLSFANEWAMGGFRVGSNGPWWSLSYEVAYYMLFAAVFYLKGGMRYLVPLLLALIFGLNILLLLPVWLMGLFLWRYVSESPAPLPKATAIGCCLLPLLLYSVALTSGLPELLKAFTQEALALSPVQLSATLRFSDEVIWNSLLGLVTTLHLLGVHSLCSHASSLAKNTSIETNIRWVAGASFSLYLVHYPVLQFFDAMLDDTVPPALWDWLLLVLTLIICFLFAQIFERPLRPFRDWIRAVAAKSHQRLA